MGHIFRIITAEDDVKKLKDKLRKRNMQIKALKESKELLQSRIRVYVPDLDVRHKLTGRK